MSIAWDHTRLQKLLYGKGREEKDKGNAYLWIPRVYQLF